MLTEWQAGEQTRHLRFLHHNSTFTLPLAYKFLNAKSSHGVLSRWAKNVIFFVLIGNPVYNLAKDPVGIWTKIIFTETTIVIELKLGMNNHWIALCKTFFFCWYKIQDGWYGRTNWTGGCYEENVCKIYFFFETPKPLAVNLTGMFLTWFQRPLQSWCCAAKYFEGGYISICLFSLSFLLLFW